MWTIHIQLVLWKAQSCFICSHNILHPVRSRDELRFGPNRRPYAMGPEEFSAPQPQRGGDVADIIVLICPREPFLFNDIVKICHMSKMARKKGENSIAKKNGSLYYIVLYKAKCNLVRPLSHPSLSSSDLWAPLTLTLYSPAFWVYRVDR